jgi:hypothetical protein
MTDIILIEIDYKVLNFIELLSYYFLQELIGQYKTTIKSPMSLG